LRLSGRATNSLKNYICTLQIYVLYFIHYYMDTCVRAEPYQDQRGPWALKFLGGPLGELEGVCHTRTKIFFDLYIYIGLPYTIVPGTIVSFLGNVIQTIHGLIDCRIRLCYLINLISVSKKTLVLVTISIGLYGTVTYNRCTL
jgi:hypothetical protein